MENSSYCLLNVGCVVAVSPRVSLNDELCTELNADEQYVQKLAVN